MNTTKSLILLLSCMFIPFAANAVRAAEPRQIIREVSDDEKAEYRRLDGEWNVTYAAFQKAGPITYTFNNGMLVIDSRQHDSGPHHIKGAGPATVDVVRYRFRLEINRLPKGLILTPLDGERADRYILPPEVGADGVAKKTNGGDAHEQSRIYEFRDGMLWICPDNGPTPKNSTSLKNGQFGDGWLVGLVPTKPR